MNPDPGLDVTRAVRTRTSREHGNDPKRLVEHYIEYQRRFGSRLVSPPCIAPEGEEPAVDAVAPDEARGTR